MDKQSIKTNITLGNYQLKQAKSYLSEHMNEGSIKIRVNKSCLNFDKSKILFLIIRSKHSKATKYRVYCKYNPNIKSPDSIEWWYCTCKTGERTVGCCTHVATIVYFFSYAQYLDSISDPAGELLSIFVYNNKDTNEDEKEKVDQKTEKNNFVKGKKRNISDSNSVQAILLMI